MADVCKTDLQKVISYLDEAAKLYDALPMQKCKCRAYMITQLTNKLKTKLNDKKMIWQERWLYQRNCTFRQQ